MLTNNQILNKENLNFQKLKNFLKILQKKILLNNKKLGKSTNFANFPNRKKIFEKQKEKIWKIFVKNCMFEFFSKKINIFIENIQLLYARLYHLRFWTLIAKIFPQ